MTLAALKRSIDEARTLLHEAGVSERLRELADGEHGSFDEAMESEPAPVPASEADAHELLAAMRSWPARMREAVAERPAWRAEVRERWLAQAAEIERRHA